MTTRLIIARHGNTFTKDQTPTRVGCQTDLALVEEERGTLLGRYIKEHNMLPQVVWAAPLKRTMQTAELAVREMGLDIKIIPDHSFVEIDYGPDENKTEDEVMLRLGKTYLAKAGKDVSQFSEEEIKARGKIVIDEWNADATVPEGWIVDPAQIIKTWQNFAAKVEQDYVGQTALIVSSNGVLRFAPYLTGNFAEFSASHDIKVGTGNLCIFEKEAGDKNWKCMGWDIKPKDYFKNKI
jgi:probable phosphoglycerate mutase